MKKVKVTLVFHVDETTEKGQEIIKDVKESTLEDFRDEDDEPECIAKEYHYKINDL